MGCCKKVKQIVTGYTSLLKRQPLGTEAKKRLTLCRNCESNRWRGLRMWCKECFCYIPAKVRVVEAKCPLGKW